MSSTRTLLVVLSLVLILGTATVWCISLAVAELADGAVKPREDFRTSTSGLEYEWLKSIDEQVLYQGMPRTEVESLLGKGGPCPDGAGMEGRTCVVPCPSWEDIRSNYPGCSEGLDWLMGRRRPFDEGRIVFWHGASGTGKTFAIRALMRAWRRMSVELIVDPEAFLGSPQYLRELVAHRPRRGALLGRTPVGGSDKERGRLFVLEDAGSLLLDGSRFELGPSVARLLNLTDGLLGQGLRIVFLVTTNEPLGAIDPALTRPGRCLQALGFPTFDQEQARSWLESHGCADPVAPSGSTLADLYAQKHGRRHPGLGAEIAPLGFRM